MKEFLVSEIFGPTIQGEGPSSGRPCVFLRLAVCNLHCSWCDTPYTWAFSERKAEMHHSGVKYDKADEVHRMGIDDVAMEVSLKLGNIPTQHLWEPKLVVISGGEPMLQQDRIIELVEKMDDCEFEIETAGTIKPWPAFRQLENVCFNVSPKLMHSGNSDKARYVTEALDVFAVTRRATFKFVVGHPDQLDEIEEDFVDAFNIPHDRVYIMPLGTLAEEVIEGMRTLAEPVLQRGWNLTTRMHTLIWGAERGR